jgi:hypothetical protein
MIKKPQKRRPRPDLGCSVIGTVEGRKSSVGLLDNSSLFHTNSTFILKDIVTLDRFHLQLAVILLLAKCVRINSSVAVDSVTKESGAGVAAECHDSIRLSYPVCSRKF